jgi:hypothetical protein
MLYFARGIETWQCISAARVYRTDLVCLPIAAAAAAAVVAVVGGKPIITTKPNALTGHERYNNAKDRSLTIFKS